jgi:hypothetical protein
LPIPLSMARAMARPDCTAEGFSGIET